MRNMAGRNHTRRYYVRGYSADTGDIRTFASDDQERADPMRRQMTEDLEDVRLTGRREKAPA